MALAYAREIVLSIHNQLKDHISDMGCGGLELGFFTISGAPSQWDHCVLQK